MPLAVLCTRRAPGLQDVPLPGEGERLTGVRCVTRVESPAFALLVLLARKNETLSHTFRSEGLYIRKQFFMSSIWSVSPLRILAEVWM